MERRTLFGGWVLPAVLVAPQLAITVLFFLLPAWRAFAESVRATDAFGLNTSFVGLANFIELFQSETYREALLRTGVFCVAVTVLAMGGGLVLAAFANRANADLFLSIHHDSAQLHYLHKTTVNGKTAYQTIKPIRGYSLFVSQKNPQFRKSLLFAEQIGSQLSFTSNRKPTLHHAEKIAGENRELLDAKLGIYRFDDLVVLAKTKIPAVLLEVGVIVDADDEAYVNNPQHQKTMINAISNAVDLYFLNSGV